MRLVRALCALLVACSSVELAAQTEHGAVCEGGDPAAQSYAVDTAGRLIRGLVFPNVKRVCRLTQWPSRGVAIVDFVQRGTRGAIAFEVHESGAAYIQGTPDSLNMDIFGTDDRWEVECSVDPIDDSRMCFASRGNLYVFRSASGHSVDVGSDNFPGSTIAVRVDRNAAVTGPGRAGIGGSRAQALISQLRQGRTALTRFQKWPEPAPETREVQLFGFGVAVDVMNRMYALLRVGK
jgi:hypothetical protein